MSSSADTSISSVATEPHPEPTLRRRLSPSSCNVSSSHVVYPSTDVSSATAAAPTTVPVRKQNNPYMYNVLGENASPELAARTSPIPRSPSPPMNTSVTSWVGDDDFGSHYGATGNTTQPALAEGHSFDAPQHMKAQPLPHPNGRAMGGYMAAAYKSVFPPGHLPSPCAPDTADLSRDGDVLSRAASTVTASSRTSPTSRGPEAAPPPASHKSRRSRQRRPSPVVTQADRSPLEPRSPVSPTAQSPTSPLTRVYRNGRPIPVPSQQ